MRRKICVAAAAVDVRGLVQLFRDRLERAHRDEEEVRHGQPEADEDARHLRPVRVEEPGDVQVEDPVDDAEVVVQEPLPDEQREEARHRPRDEDQRAVEALEPQPLLVQDDREQKPDEEREEDGRRREDDRPDEDPEERAAERLAREDRAEVVEADRRLPARLQLLPAVHERALAVVAEHDAVADARERVGLRVVAQRRLELDGRRDRLRRDRALAGASARGTRAASGRARRARCP